jgi:serine/threonine protein kinase
VHATNRYNNTTRTLCHPNVLPLLGCQLKDDKLMMIMPFMKNGNLKQYLTHHPHIDLLRCCINVCDAIEYIHKKGLMHRDIKPENILV